MSTGPPSLPAPTGLVNLTNTCFMNSSIQLVWRALLDELLCETKAEYFYKTMLTAMIQAKKNPDDQRVDTAKTENIVFEGTRAADKTSTSSAVPSNNSLSKKDKRALLRKGEADPNTNTGSASSSSASSSPKSEGSPTVLNLREGLCSRISRHLAAVGSGGSDVSTVGDGVPTKEAAAFCLLSHLFLKIGGAEEGQTSNVYGARAKARAAHGILSAVKQKMAEQNERFLDWDQHDAHELAQSLIAVLHAELNRGVGMTKDTYKAIDDVKKDETEAEATQRWLRHLFQRDNSLITDMFYFTTRTVTTCHSCGHKSYNFDSVGELQLNLMETHGNEGLSRTLDERRVAMADKMAHLNESLSRTTTDKKSDYANDDSAAFNEGNADESSSSSSSDEDEADDCDEKENEKEGKDDSGENSNKKGGGARAENKKEKEGSSQHCAASASKTTSINNKRLTAKQLKAQQKAEAKAAKEAAKAEKRAKRNNKQEESSSSKRSAAKAESTNKQLLPGKTLISRIGGAMGGWARSLIGSCVSLQDLIEHQLDTSEDVDDYKCDKCLQKVVCTKRTTVISYPRYWLLAITRFTPDGRKIKTPVAFPQASSERSAEDVEVEEEEGEEGSASCYAPYRCPQREGACYLDLITPRDLLKPLINTKTVMSKLRPAPKEEKCQNIDSPNSPMGCRFDSTSDAEIGGGVAYTEPSRVNRYEVLATVNHLGSTLNFGHYTANVRRALPSSSASANVGGGLGSVGLAGMNGDDDGCYAGEWYHCDDDDIEAKNIASSSVLPTSQQGGDGNVYLVLLKAVGNTHGRGFAPCVAGEHNASNRKGKL